MPSMSVHTRTRVLISLCLPMELSASKNVLCKKKEIFVLTYERAEE